MFKYVIYGQTENEANDLLKIAGIDDLDDALIISTYITSRDYFVGSDKVVRFGVMDTQENKIVYPQI